MTLRQGSKRISARTTRENPPIGNLLREATGKPMLQAASKYRESFATAYIHQLAWQKTGHRNYVAFARIAGKPTFVKAMAGSLLRENHIRVQIDKERVEYLYGTARGRCLYHKIDKTGIATYYSTNLFDHNSAISHIIGETIEDTEAAFKAILKAKPIISHDAWDMKGILEDLQLITPMETYNVIAYEVMWDEDKITEHLSGLVKEKKLRF